MTLENLNNKIVKVIVCTFILLLILISSNAKAIRYIELANDSIGKMFFLEEDTSEGGAEKILVNPTDEGYKVPAYWRAIRFKVVDLPDKTLHHFKITCKQKGISLYYTLDYAPTNEEGEKWRLVGANGEPMGNVTLAGNSDGVPLTEYEYGSTSIDVPLMTGVTYRLAFGRENDGNFGSNVLDEGPITIQMQYFSGGDCYVSPINSVVVSGKVDDIDIYTIIPETECGQDAVKDVENIGKWVIRNDPTVDLDVKKQRTNMDR